MANNRISEHAEQATFIESVLWQYRSDPTFLRRLFFAVPNGAYLGGRSALQYAKLKKEGFVNGVSDVLYLQPRGEHPFFSLELKTQYRRGEKSGGISEDQLSFMISLLDTGAYISVAYGADEAIEDFSRYMRLPARAPIVRIAPPMIYSAARSSD